jgi:hypothetical protein
MMDLAPSGLTPAWPEAALAPTPFGRAECDGPGGAPFAG